jgi:hypothetical protein
MRLVSSLACLVVACGRDQGVSDEQLKGLVVETKPPSAIDVDQATKDPAELARAMASSHGAVLAALGPHSLALETHTIVEEGGKPVSDLADKTLLELGEQGAFHGLYENSADYGREAIFKAGKLYLRPRYQKWHGRTPETLDEPAQLRDSYFGPIAATWDLVGPAAELTDKGAVTVAGRAGRKILVKLAPSARELPHEALPQRKWRETRTIAALDGEVTIDVEKGVPLAIDLTGAVAFSREGRRFTMKLAIKGAITKLGATELAAPPDGDVIATPTRRGEVDERDYLLNGIAPPIRKNADGTALVPSGSGSGSGSGR